MRRKHKLAKVDQSPNSVASPPFGSDCWTSLFFTSTAAAVVSLSVFLAYYFLATANADEPLSETLSNGTHLFGRTVVLVSFDGFRSDYLLRGLTPDLTDISKRGICAEYMKPIFPSKSKQPMMANHFRAVQYPATLKPSYTYISQSLDTHDWFVRRITWDHRKSYFVLPQDFYDPQYQTTFVNNHPEAGEPYWWLGEPIWETVERAGLYSANLMWPGPSMTSSGIRPRYQVSFTPHCSPVEKISQVLEWIDLPLERRPQLILVYEPMLDQAGHTAGPDSELQTLPVISKFAHTLVQSLHNERNLSHIVDILFVSDHGMEDTSSWGMVYMDDILCYEQSAREHGWPACAGVQHVDGWPSMGLWFEPGVDTAAVLSRLVLASKLKKFDVYTTYTYNRNTSDPTSMIPKMPERYHYYSSRRLAPIWVVPRFGYALTTRVENGSMMSIGNHGYDNDEHSMRALFISQGPFAARAKKQLQEERNRTGECMFSPFQNVELYNLIVRLLSIDKWASETNGTKGFWDRWTRFRHAQT